MAAFHSAPLAGFECPLTLQFVFPEIAPYLARIPSFRPAISRLSRVAALHLRRIAIPITTKLPNIFPRSSFARHII
jgi:hypothetical protein